MVCVPSAMGIIFMLHLAKGGEKQEQRVVKFTSMILSLSKFKMNKITRAGDRFCSAWCSLVVVDDGVSFPTGSFLSLIDSHTVADRSRWVKRSSLIGRMAKVLRIFFPARHTHARISIDFSKA